MNRQYDLITVDIFSAALDIEGSAAPAVQQILDTTPEEGLRFFRLWRQRQWDYLLLSSCMGKEHLSYKDITAATLSYTQKKLGYTQLEQGAVEQLMALWYRFRAWPEAKQALDALRAKGYRVAMLSNGDDDMLRSLQAFNDLAFDAVFSAEQAGCYKPCPGIYMLPREKTGISPQRLLHVAGSVYDMMGAKAAGLHCAWVNRTGEYSIDSRYQPDIQVAALDELAGLL